MLYSFGLLLCNDVELCYHVAVCSLSIVQQCSNNLMDFFLNTFQVQRWCVHLAYIIFFYHAEVLYIGEEYSYCKGVKSVGICVVLS